MVLIDALRGDEVASLEADVAAGRRDHALKALDERGRAQELIRQQYTGRYPFELLQNANDAAAEGARTGRVRFILTETALVIADSGSGFGDEQVRAICGLGRSSKDPRKSIGYKGLGFKSVGEITDQPQVISEQASFEFDEQRVFDLVAAITGPLDERQRLPVYAFPFGLDADAHADAPVVNEARADGLTTVLRLPLKKGVRVDEVRDHLVYSLVPRLLLFLPSIEELELRGTSRDFVAVLGQEEHEDCTEVLLEYAGSVEHWLVYRRPVPVDQQLVAPLGDAWKDVELVHVAVGVPLDDGGEPSTERQHPVHVYFPTEERTGLSVVLQGDFALQLDRRQLATNPEAVPFNQKLITELAALIGDEVTPSLSRRFPGSSRTVGLFAPRSARTGVGELVFDEIVRVLQPTRFLPAVDGAPRVAAEARLMPGPPIDPVQVLAHLDRSRVGRQLVPGVEADTAVRDFLRLHLDVQDWRLGELLDQLDRPAPDDLEDFYAMLVSWADTVGLHRFSQAVAGQRFVHTVDGGWVAPAADRVFFPRQRDDVDIPEDLPVPIVSVPDVDGLDELLRSAGVRDFEWRELLTDYLLPLLTVPDTTEELRDRALSGLRAYYLSQRGGDPRLARRIREVLVPARSMDGTEVVLRPAGATYFGSDWTRSTALDRIYGPFGEPEFLAESPPEDGRQRSMERDFLAWIGVADHPRVLEAWTDQRETYKCDNIVRHPHYGQPGWTTWWTSELVAEQRKCEQGHPYSQQLRRSHALDRFAGLVRAQDTERLLALWYELSRHWGSVYQPATQAQFYCQHSGHGGDRERYAPSLLLHELVTEQWVPASLAGEMRLVRPREAWRLALDTPRWVGRRVPAVDERMVEASGAALATTLEVTDAARPAPQDLARLLLQLREEYEQSGEQSREIHSASRWAMRTLNDVLLAHPEHGGLRGVPLLARFRGTPVFTDDPVVATDPLLAETWEVHYPILDADRDLRRLHEALGLRVLDDSETGVRVRPIPRGMLEDERTRVSAHFGRAQPYLAVAAISNTPSRERDVLRGLSRLELVVCEELILRYEYDGQVIDRDEATSYIAVRQEVVRGAIRRNIGTAHLEVNGQGADPDWYAFGRQLAEHLSVPTMGDAFALLLKGDDADRQQFLTAHRIPAGAVEDARNAFTTPDDDGEFAVDFGDLEDFDPDAAYLEPRVAPRREAPAGQGAGAGYPPEGPPVHEQVDMPEIDVDAVTVEDADTGDARPRPTRSARGGGLGPEGPVDHEGTDQRSRLIGRRGEEAVVAAERKRVAAFGGDPDVVYWRSERNPLAPFDVESLDDDGQRIFIEVKSTSGDDPTTPFLVSHGELLEALRLRSRYFIYRVTEVDTARPRIHRYRDPAGLLIEEHANLSMAGARMWFGGRY